jgi:hypothetical protein
MPIQYGQYNLANSQRVKPFAGSTNRELTSVAGTLQERYEKALETEDALSRVVKMSQAAPFAQDQQLLAGLKEEFKTKMQQRAQAGDYENMVRDTMLDARNFTDRYGVIADNAKRYQEYQNQLQEQVTKGDIKSPDKARRLLALATQNYQGLQYDPSTGQYSNQFKGLPAVKDIDPTEKVDKWMKDLAPTVLGSKIVFTDGVWKKFQEGKTVTLKQNEIDKILAAGMQSDPEFQAWYGQEQQLAGADYGKVTTDDIGKLQPGPTKDALVKAWQSGIEPKIALQQMAASRRGSEISGVMRQYSSKYIRDDKETGSGIMDADPYNLERMKKKIADEELVLSMPILQPEARMEISGAEDLTTKLQATNKARTIAIEKFDKWVFDNDLQQDEKGNWKNSHGDDLTLKYLQQKQAAKQASDAWHNLHQLDMEARKRTGYGKGTVTPELIKKAEAAGERALSRMAGEILQPGEAAEIRKSAKEEYLAKNAPGYAQYSQALKDMTAKGSQLINVQNFNNKPANDQALNLFKNLVLNLDANGVSSGTQGLTWASGNATGDPLEAGDYKKVAANAEFAGWGMDTDGELKYFYKVGDVKQNSKGKLVGEQALVKMPALPGTVDVLLKHKQITPAQLALGQSINKTINAPNGEGYIKIGNDEIFIDRIDKSEIGNTEVSGGLNISFPMIKDGILSYTVVPVNSVGEAINTITNAIQRTQAKQAQTKQK